MKKHMQSLLESTPGLLALIITDKDGVVIMKVCRKDNPELSQRNNYIAPFASASEQASKLGLGKNNTIICFYDKFQVVSINKGAVSVHLVGSPQGNTGDFLTLDFQLENLLPNLANLVTTDASQTHCDPWWVATIDDWLGLLNALAFASFVGPVYWRMLKHPRSLIHLFMQSNI